MSERQSAENDARCHCDAHRHAHAPHTAENDALTAAVTVTIARVRCEALHDQTNGGRCTACIAWANRNASRYLPRFRVTPPAECEHDPRYSHEECVACGGQVSWCDRCGANLCGCPIPPEVGHDDPE